MKKGALLFFMVFLMIPVAFADINLQTEQSIYNLGNKIRASASVLQSNNFEGLFKLMLSCGNYKLQYFLTPVSLEANFRTAVNVPEIVASSSMLGNCSITGDLVTNDNLIVEEKDSNGFSVTNQLNVLPVNTKITALPGDTIKVTGVVNEAFGNNVLKASAEIAMDNNSYSIDAVDGKFNFTLELPKNIKSGEHKIGISASDAKGNSGSSSILLGITAVPTYIKTELSSDSILPGSRVDITSSLYDQADDLINASLNLELTAPSGNKVFNKAVQSNEKIDYEFSQYAEPGMYNLESTYKNLLEQSSINVTTIREVKIKYENETVLIENTGNIPFIDELTFILENEAKKYPLTKKINVEPGKILNLDLSKEVPLGVYDVLIPVKEGIEPVSEKINETFQNLVESAAQSIGNLLPESEGVLADDVTIHDNRPAYKKIASGLSSISGALVGADGVLTKSPLTAPAILVVIIGLLVFRYGRKPLMRLIKGKKDDDNKENQN